MTQSRRKPGPAVTKRPEKTKSTPKQKLKKVALWLGVAGLVGALVAVGGFVVAYQSIDIPDANEEFKTQTSFVYYADGEREVGQFARQNRVSVSLEDVPKRVQDAVVAAENKSFWNDRGIDPKGIVRAAFSNARAGETTQGASTITQQYVKILYLTSERKLSRKVKEAILSLKIQREMSKREILEGYLNTIYFGRGAYGIQAASEAYFNKGVKRLKLREAAFLASVLNSPSAYDPANGEEAEAAVTRRYQYTLGRMADDGYITQEKAETAAKRLPKFPKQEAQSAYGGQKGHMLKLVRDELLRLGYTETQIDGGGLRVTTTFDPEMMSEPPGGGDRAAPRGIRRPAAAHRRRHGRARHRGAQGVLRRPGLPRLPDQLGRDRGHGRLDDEGLHHRHGDQGGLLPRGPVPGLLAVHLPRRDHQGLQRR